MLRDGGFAIPISKTYQVLMMCASILRGRGFDEEMKNEPRVDDVYVCEGAVHEIPYLHSENKMPLNDYRHADRIFLIRNANPLGRWL
jgi:hypothetical protein